MAEIAITDLPAATRAKFASDAAAQAALNAVLAAARRYCGWHVSPVRTGEALTVDGPGGWLLDLPTRKMSALTSVTEDGTALDVTKLTWSANGSVRKKSGYGWTCTYRAIVATITHGYTETEAADWRNAIIVMVDTVATVSGTVEAGRLVRKKVDDVEYQWDTAAEGALLSVSYVLDSYQLFPVYFA